MSWKVRYSYLLEQFAEPDEILDGIRRLVATGQYTLGPAVAEFEAAFAALIGARHAIGVGSGTDALMLSLRAAGVGFGDEVVTAANTFIATVGAINAVGARPVLVDVTSYYTIDAARIEERLTPRTRAIVPVHLTGEPADMGPIMAIARRHGLAVVEDACQAILGAIDDRPVGTFGVAAGFSLHPLKNLNVWGDAGVIVTDADDVDGRLRLLRNHGLRSRDEVEILGYNSRLDTLQAMVGNGLVKHVPAITGQRIANARVYDEAFADLAEHVTTPPRRPNATRVYHLYMLQVRDRDALHRHLLEHGVEAKIHYPIPLHLQPGLAHLGYRRGDFPESERQADAVISLPVDQHLTRGQLDYTIDVVREFYRRGAPRSRP